MAKPARRKVFENANWLISYIYECDGQWELVVEDARKALLYYPEIRGSNNKKEVKYFWNSLDPNWYTYHQATIPKYIHDKVVRELIKYGGVPKFKRR